MKKGIFCISIDTELLWGRHAYNYKNFINNIGKERQIIKSLLSEFGANSIPATWAVVGHLFLDKCTKINGVKHPEIIKPKWMLGKKDWFDLDPCTSIDKDPLWYGTDIIKEIRSIKYQEIASHSFSHMIFSDKRCIPECAESDIKACKVLAKNQGINLTSFVFPVNLSGHLEIVKKYGFTAFRGREKYWYRNIKFLGKIFQIFDLLIPISPPVGETERVNGLINVPGSFYFVSNRGIRRYIPKNIRFQKAKRGIDKTIRDKKIFHLWAHPVDFVDNKLILLEEFFEVIRYANKKRHEGLIDIKTMSEISKEYKYDKTS